MPRFIGRSLGVALLVTLMVAGPAGAIVSGPVTVRVEGTSSTVLAKTTVTPDGTPFTKDGDATHTCDGTSAGDALQLATKGNWTGTYFSSFNDYLVSSIGGVSESGSWFWNFWYNNAPAMLGVCGQHPLNAGDSILFFPDCFGAGCPAGYVSPNVLDLAAGTTAQKGQQFGVVVFSYAAANGARSQANGATVTGGGASGTTDASGVALLTFPTVGTFQIQATAPNSIRSPVATVCVHDGNDGNCGTTGPSSTPTPTPTPTRTPTPTPSGGGQTPAPLVAALSGIADGQTFRRGHGPRTLRGNVQDGVALTDIALRLRSRVGRRCSFYSSRRERFVKTNCGDGPFFSVGPSSPFSYLLPRKLGRGHYALEVEAADVLGRHGASLIRFNVG